MRRSESELSFKRKHQSVSPLPELPPEVRQLCEQLRESADRIRNQNRWPSQQIAWCRQAEVFRWFIPKELGGLGWSEAELLAGYLALSQSCLTTTFILTQWVAACRRLVASENIGLRRRIVPRLAAGECFATVGISHLTTSRQHVRPVLTAEELPGGKFRLDGFSPWVTAAPTADLIVLGASLDDGRQIIAAVETDQPNVTASPGEQLVALSASCTGRIDLTSVEIAADDIVAGPVKNVMATNSGGGAGGLQTSTLAIGHSKAASRFLLEQSRSRHDLARVAEKICADVTALEADLYQLTCGQACGLDASELRRRANSLVLRSTQAALSAAKGAGFVASHPAGRWACEALFFLVWSCPQGVVDANLCELAQLSS